MECHRCCLRACVRVATDAAAAAGNTTRPPCCHHACSTTPSTAATSPRASRHHRSRRCPAPPSPRARPWRPRRESAASAAAACAQHRRPSIKPKKTSRATHKQRSICSRLIWMKQGRRVRPREGGVYIYHSLLLLGVLSLKRDGIFLGNSLHFSSAKLFFTEFSWGVLPFWTPASVTSPPTLRPPIRGICTCWWVLATVYLCGTFTGSSRKGNHETGQSGAYGPRPTRPGRRGKTVHTCQFFADGYAGDVMVGPVPPFHSPSESLMIIGPPEPAD